MKRRLSRALLALLLVLIILPVVGSAAAAPPDPLMPPRTASAPAYGTETPLYDDLRYPFHHYTFQGDAFTSPGYNTFYLWMNVLMVAKSWLLKMGIRMVEYALTQNLFEVLAERVDGALGALSRTLWEVRGASLVGAGLAISGAWILLLRLRGRTTAVWGAVGGTLLIIMVSSAFTSVGGSFMRESLSLSRAVSVQVFTAVERVSQGGTDDSQLVQKSGDVAWNALVFEPWVTGQLGTEAGRVRYRSGQVDGGRMLAQTEQERLLLERDCQNFRLDLQNQYCPWWQTQYLPRRIFLVVATAAATALYGGTLVALAGGMMLAQLSLLFVLALSPVWLLIGLWWPGTGVRLVGNLLMRVLGALVSQAVLAVTLSLLLLMTVSLSALLGDPGWMYEAIVLAALGGLAFHYRYAWTAPLASARQRVERDGPGFSEAIRRWMGRSLPPVPAVGGAAAIDQARLIPTFASIQQPPVEGKVQMTPLDQRPPHLPEMPQRQMEMAKPQVAFQTQMQILREQFVLREDRPERERVMHTLRHQNQPIPQSDIAATPAVPGSPIGIVRGKRGYVNGASRVGGCAEGYDQPSDK